MVLVYRWVWCCVLWCILSVGFTELLVVRFSMWVSSGTVNGT